MSQNHIPAHYKDQLLDELMYVAEPETRRHLMLTVPAAYNAWCGREIVKVVRTSDDTEVEAP